MVGATSSTERVGIGLTSEEAARALLRDGPNVLPSAHGPSATRRLVGQFVHFFALLLWVAAGLALIAGLSQLAVAIVVVVIVNGVFSFLQEHRAERAAERLRDLLPRTARVVRDGRETSIDAGELVVGDVVLLAEGDRVSADLEALKVERLRLDTSTLTGESEPTSVDLGDVLYGGTFVVEGEGIAVVRATGTATRLAGLAQLTRSAHRPPSPLAIELHRVVRLIALIAGGVGTGFFVLALLLGTPVADGLVFAIGVTVALVPEGLLPTVTLALAMGAQRMAGRDALVRRLESVETLGSTTFICSDKTGTLTANQQTVVAVWTPAGLVEIDGPGYGPTAEITGDPAAREAARHAALGAGRSSRGRAVEEAGRWIAHGEPMDAAADALARRFGVDLELDRRTRPDRFHLPFDGHRMRASVAAGDRLYVKGAPEGVLQRCRLDPSERSRVDEALVGLLSRGLRVLAVATRELPSPDAMPIEAAPPDAEELERELELLALLGFEDPPRAGVADAIARCRGAGIRIAMITGDHPATARTIAIELGIIGPDGLVLEGTDLPADEAVLGALVDRDGIVLSRISPEDKLRIARSLQQRGHVVAMTGDGVNDGPALQEADIGIAMGRGGTDVAREAADLVLLDDDFSTIVVAVELGRASFSNIRRFLTYHLTDNVAELTPFVVWALSGGRFPLALGVMQVLALDIGTDTLPAVALGAEPPDRRTLDRPPLRGHLLDRGVATRAFGILGPTEATVSMAAFVVSLVGSGWRPGESFPEGPALYAASGAAFLAVVLGQMANSIACRSTTRSPLLRGSRHLHWWSNRILVVALAVEVPIVAAFFLVPAVADALNHSLPTIAGGVVASTAPVAVLTVDLMAKLFRSRSRRGSGLPATPRVWRAPPSVALPRR